LPARSFAAVDIVAVYFLPVWRFADGVHVIATPLQDHAHVAEGEKDTAPSVAVWFIPSLHEMLSLEVIETFVAPFAGIVLTTYGRLVSPYS
jgi:hypothetical protein